MRSDSLVPPTTFMPKPITRWRKKLKRCLISLELNPHRHPNIKRLKGKFAGSLRYRVGDWRVIYEGDEAAGVVYVLDIAHRKDIYE